MKETLLKMLDEKAYLREHLFVRGFLLTNNKNLDLNKFPFYGNWQETKVTDEFTAYTHCKQKVTISTNNGISFFLFGHAYNPFTMEYEEEKVLSKIAENYNTPDFQNSIELWMLN